MIAAMTDGAVNLILRVFADTPVVNDVWSFLRMAGNAFLGFRHNGDEEKKEKDKRGFIHCSLSMEKYSIKKTNKFISDPQKSVCVPSARYAVNGVVMDHKKRTASYETALKY
jgi:hypothetical protein